MVLNKTGTKPPVNSPLVSKGFFQRLKRNVVLNWDLYLFCIPGLVLIGVFNYIPMYDGIVMAFKDFIPKLGVSGSKWVGLGHFQRLFSAYNFWSYLGNTLLLSLYSLLATFPLPIAFAIMINELPLHRFKKVVQTISYAPNFLSVVVVVGMMNLFFSGQGPLAYVFNELGLEAPSLLGSANTFRHMYVWSGVWQTLGYSAILYIAALSNVDPQLVEAAQIDGASKLQRIWHIELPCLIPTATIMLVFSIGSLMSVGFEKILLMQTPLNTGVSEVIATYVYKTGILATKYSFAAAVGLFNSVVNFILLTIANFISKRVSETSLW